MKSQLLLATAVGALVVVSGCTARHERMNWSEDCMKHYSTTSREYRTCMDRVRSSQTFSDTAGKVDINPKAVDYPGLEEGNAPERGSESSGNLD